MISIFLSYQKSFYDNNNVEKNSNVFSRSRRQLIGDFFFSEIVFLFFPNFFSIESIALNQVLSLRRQPLVDRRELRMLSSIEYVLIALI